MATPEDGQQAIQNLKDKQNDVNSITPENLGDDQFQVIYDANAKYDPNYFKGKPVAVNTLVNDSGGTYLSNTDTSDPAAPEVCGPFETDIPDSPEWELESLLTQAVLHKRWTLTKSGYITPIQVYQTKTTEGLPYTSVLLVQIPSATTPVSESLPQFSNGSADWIFLKTANAILPAGTVIDVYHSVQNSGALESVSLNLTFAGQNIGPVDPGDWQRDANNTVIRISTTDRDSNDITADVAKISVGDTLNFTNQTTFGEYSYLVQQVTDVQATYYEFAVTISLQQGNFNTNDLTQCDFNTSAASSAEFSILPNRQNTDWATIEAFVNTGSGDVATTDDLPIRIGFTEACFSDDWIPIGNGFIGNTGSTPEPSSTKVIVRGDDQLPPVSGGFSTLEPNTQYEFENGATITKNLRVDSIGVRISGRGVFPDNVIFAGTGDFLTIDNFSVQIDNIRILSGAGNQFINALGNGVETTLTMQTVQLSGGAKIGTLDGVTPTVRDFIAIGHEDGFTFLNSIRGLTFNNAFMFSTVGTPVAFDFGTALFNEIKMNEVSVFGVGTSLSSSAGGANINPDIEAYVSECTFATPTILSGFTDGFQTNQWEFFRNSPISTTQDTEYNADSYLNLTTTPLPITNSSQGTFYAVGNAVGFGSWESTLLSHFTQDANGVLTYTGARPIRVKVDAKASIGAGGFFGDTIASRIAINFVDNTDTLPQSQAISDSGAAASMTMFALVELQPNDTIQAVFANNSSGANSINLFSYSMTIERVR